MSSPTTEFAVLSVTGYLTMTMHGKVKELSLLSMSVSTETNFDVQMPRVTMTFTDDPWMCHSLQYSISVAQSYYDIH